jgi:hypothetical protein
MQADASLAQQALSIALVAKGRYSEALDVDKQGRDQEVKDALDRGYAESGYPGARRVGQRCRRRASANPAEP